MAKRIAIIGAGLGGLAAAIKLKEAGFSQFKIFEKDNRVGGTWAQNTYPGCSCDVPVALYQYSFAPAFHWTNTFPAAGEVQTYAETLVSNFGLSEHLQLSTAMTKADWSDEKKCWTIGLSTGEVYEADIVISALGQLNRPWRPDIKGADQFTGPIMHSARWDHSIPLESKKIGVIGSAASAVQLIPEVAKVASELVVFQRSPNWIAPRGDRAIGPEEVALLMTNPAVAMDLGARNRAMIFDTAEAFFWQAFSWTPQARAAYGKIAQDHLEKQVSDLNLRAKLTPDYPVGAKRYLFANNYYPALCENHVMLETNGIKAINKTGIETVSGVQHDLDVIIFATGFETTGWTWSSMISGANGQSLAQAWQDGPRAYLGITTSGFPNFFMLYGPHTNLGHNSITYMLECQINYVVQAVSKMDADIVATLDVKPTAQAGFFAKLQSDLAKTVWADPATNSWYKDVKGQITQNWSSNCTSYAQATRIVKWEDYQTG